MGAHLLEFLKTKETVSVYAYLVPSNSACFQCLFKKIRCNLHPVYQAHGITNAYFVLLLSVTAIFSLSLTFLLIFFNQMKNNT